MSHVEGVKADISTKKKKNQHMCSAIHFRIRLKQREPGWMDDGCGFAVG